MKRPRGRPPLVGNSKRKYEAYPSNGEGMNEIITFPNNNSLPLVSPSPKSSNNTEKSSKFTISNSSVTANTNTNANSNEILNENTNTATNVSSSKIPRHQYPIHKIISRLMTEDPISVHYLSYAIPDIPKEVIISTLDILQILGFVNRLKSVYSSTSINTHLSSSSTSSSLDSSNNNSNNNSSLAASSMLYSMKGFLKLEKPVELQKISQVINDKKDNIENIKKRIEFLEELLSKEDLSEEETRNELSEFIISNNNNNSLTSDSLYRDIIYQLSAANNNNNNNNNNNDNENSIKEEDNKTMQI